MSSVGRCVWGDVMCESEMGGVCVWGDGTCESEMGGVCVDGTCEESEIEGV